MAEAGEALAFQAPMTRALRRRGLKGRTATVVLEPDGLALAGEEGGTWRVPFAQVLRVRVGFVESKHGTILFLRLWTRDAPDKKVELGGNLDRPRYGRFVRAAVAAMLRPDRAIPVETGDGLFVPIFLFGAFGLMAAFFLAFTGYLAVTGDQDWWMPLPALSVPVLLLLLLHRWILSRYVPRRIAKVEEVEKVLLGCGPG